MGSEYKILNEEESKEFYLNLTNKNTIDCLTSLKAGLENALTGVMDVYLRPGPKSEVVQAEINDIQSILKEINEHIERLQ